ncbi:gamma-glutamyltranspeptidase 2 [Amborella trichopoda]|uniref:gamma-glutamyltranspeptidase 2 n=1 Tax=Amborella trichopoda TaxID=13333 RepID=UPI0005D3A54D|nr:gamma-glutamyltranspeptidase 2 [Amborella trichopoda]|eukprot:XP_011621678.1 gamma-glutamyltranspeptidase 2 [Amborella trichopoda]
MADDPEVITVENGVVAASDGRCSEIGSKILQKGGHAVDAAVATTFCVGVVSPGSSGIGGGSFMLLRSANGQALGYDMRETAPGAASRDMYENHPAAKVHGGLSVAVPGELLSLYEAWKDHGKVPWKELVKPAIALARDGFTVSGYLHHQMEATEEAIRRDKGLREKFMRNGKLLKDGDMCRDVVLANTLEKIAVDGPSVFYNGSVGLDLLTDIQEKGGIITMEDLKGYAIKKRRPISRNVMDHEIVTMPPPASGGFGVLMVLNILDEYGIDYKALLNPLGLHRMIEAIKHMFAQRWSLGDPDFVDLNPSVAKMLSPGFARMLRSRIQDNTTHDPDYYFFLRDHGSWHLCVVDSERNAVSLTSSINFYFGALFRSQKTGIILNNQMNDFSVPSNTTSNTTMPPAPANFIEPYKRPLSSMTPTIFVKDGQLKGVIGGSGGPRIMTAVIQVFLNYFVHKMDPWASVLAPRLYHVLIPNILEYENWDTVDGNHIEVPPYIRLALAKKGHVLTNVSEGAKCQFVVHDIPPSFAEGQKIILPNHAAQSGLAKGQTIIVANLTAVCDPRKGGYPAGY